MNPITRHPAAALALGLCLALPALAQVAPADTPPAAATPRDNIERITHEDKLTRIDELRVGGQTQSIEVQPKTARRPTRSSRTTATEPVGNPVASAPATPGAAAGAS